MKNISRIPKIILTLIFSLNILISNAQNNQQEEAPTQISYLTLNLLSQLNFYSPRWRVGYIRNINPKWKMGLDLGFGNRNLSFFQENVGSDYQLWEVRPELYYIINPSKKTDKYFSFELYYISHKDTFYDGHYFPIDGESLHYDKIDFHRQKYGFTIKYGFFIFSKNKIGFNIYTGLGLRVRNNTFSNGVNSEIVDLGPEGGDMFGFYNYRNMEGVNVGPNFSLGIKLYFKLNQK